MAVNRAYEHDHLDNVISTRQFTVKQPYSSTNEVRLILKANSMCVSMTYEDAHDLINALTRVTSDVERRVNSESKES